jgi:hypothetical protein
MSAVPLTLAEQDAIVRLDGQAEGGHVESLFLKLNLPDFRALWLKLTFLRQTFGAKHTWVEAWAIAFEHGGDCSGEGQKHVAIKRSWPLSEAQIEPDCLYVRVGDVELRHGHSHGVLTCEAGKHCIQWDLNFDTASEGFRHLPYEWMYRRGLPKSKANSPQVDTRFHGTITVDGVKTKVEDAPGMLGHNWGQEHAESWTWAHCNQWLGVEGVLFEGVTSEVKMGPVLTPPLSVIHVRIPGEWMTFNSVMQLFKTESHREGLKWKIRATSSQRQIEAVFHAEVPRFVGVDYHDPGGRIVHCLNTKIADAELAVYGKTAKGWNLIFSATADKSAAFEIGTRDETHGVTMAIR